MKNAYEGYTLEMLIEHSDFMSEWIVDLSDEMIARPNIHLEIELSHLIDRHRQLQDQIVKLSVEYQTSAGEDSCVFSQSLHTL